MNYLAKVLKLNYIKFKLNLNFSIGGQYSKQIEKQWSLFKFLYLSIYVSIYLSTYLSSIYLPTYLSSICQSSTYLSSII
jgi:hypothetical protein